MKRERLDQPAIHRSQVDARLALMPNGRWLYLLAQELGVPPEDLLTWLRKHNYRLEYSKLCYKWSVYAKQPKRERL